ncbi:MAG TPA: cytochrome-c oxidase, cbb3-type subunit III [Povalibacter sp.]|uniref:cytochrome-c oxidase, cbb3-type subunit III n=1 Tax=Povalibacter sp. TaxID=1962978 RepID=UPI002C356C40|nr:cytochrome-c oxidase, cbb3-type subunit III [Povalibacter sp.]HMN43071.1 cytochrome-c oxidase, cbb3-type subunit III [Povalibacter sp.]
MSRFWSGWVMFLVVLNLGITLFLFVWAQRLKIPTRSDGTTGHVWAHGVLREGVRRLPLWWVLFSAGMFIVGFAYLALYPGFGSYQGRLGWTSASEWLQDTQVNDAKLAATLQPLSSLSVEELARNDNARALGERLFLDNCAACHGTRALGNPSIGAPNLVDDDWLYGEGTLMASVLDGRTGAMPPWGPALGHEGVKEVASYVLSLSGVKAPADWVAAGKTRYEAICVACHGADGRGNPALGAPNLTDSVWLYGNDFASVAASIEHGRSGVMPAWRHRLGEEQVRMIAAWLHSQGST